MMDHVMFRYDYGWDPMEKAEIAQDYEESYGEKPTDEELDDYIYRVQSEDWDNILIEADYYEKEFGQKRYVILARIGTWRGTFDAGKVVTGMKEAISVCCDDCEYFTLTYKNNQFKIVGHHHDGTNTYIIRELTEKGEEYCERDSYRGTTFESCKRMFKDSHLTHMASIFPKIYGWI